MKKILITGASEGIGLETATLLAQAGHQLTLVARNREKLERVVASLPGEDHTIIAADLSKKDQAHMIGDHLKAHHHDVLINNAGVGMYGRFESLPLDKQAYMMTLNMISLTALSHAYLSNAHKGDCLVNVASSLGLSSFPGLAVYAGTKAFVSNFSDSLWWENRSRGIYVLGFCPGATATSFHETAGEGTSIFPGFVMQTAAQVAKELVHAIERRKKPRVVSGEMTRFMLFFQRFLPRKMAVNIMGGFSPIHQKKGKAPLKAASAI